MAIDRRFLVLHGWQNRRPRQHWQWQLVEALRSAGEQVLYPQLPDPDTPQLEVWTEVVRAELEQLGGGNRVVVAHSLAVPLWLHVAGSLDDDSQASSRVLLVAPPSPVVLRGYPEVADFGRVEHDLVSGWASGRVRMVHGDTDPYCPEGARQAYAGLGLDQRDVDVIAGGGHLDSDAGYGWWPSVRDWCLDPSTRLAPR